MATDINVMRKVLADIWSDKFIFDGIEDYSDGNLSALHLAWLEDSGLVTLSTSYAPVAHIIYTEAFHSLLGGFAIDPDTEIQSTEQLEKMVAL